MLAATSLVTAAAAISPATAGDLDPVATPTTIEAPVVAVDDAAATQSVAKPAQRALLITVALGAIGWLVKLLGPKRVLRAVEQTAEATVKASAAAAKTAARAVRSPLRFLALMSGLALFALTGVGLYDIEWIGGLVAGAALTGTAAFGSWKAKRALQPKPVRVKQPSMPNKN